MPTPIPINMATYLVGPIEHHPLQSNRLETMCGFEACTALEELYLSHNGIWRIEVRKERQNKDEG